MVLQAPFYGLCWQELSSIERKLLVVCRSRKYQVVNEDSKEKQSAKLNKNYCCALVGHFLSRKTIVLMESSNVTTTDTTEITYILFR